MTSRVGFGYDVHRLEEGRPFWLGGVEIPYHKGALGHSDADVLIHAICDALLGAAALGDIGTHFPDSDPAYKGIPSSLLLGKVCILLRDQGYRVGNVDSTVCLQEPKIKPFIQAMREQLAMVMETDISNISVKATTEEGLGITGKGEGISAYAVVMVHKA
jgi:2-C-methyl-D-erythritol 2,4-cyclodiphosphate synthase